MVHNLTNIESYLTFAIYPPLSEELIKKFENLEKNISEFNLNISSLFSNDNSIVKEMYSETLFICSKYNKIKEAIKALNGTQKFKNNNIDTIIKMFGSIKEDFKDLKSEFLEKYYYYARVARACGKVLTMIYFCLLIIVTTFTGISMMFYACLKRQGYLSIFMHVFWNIIRFFMFSFFVYGAAFGMGYLAIKDAVAYVMYVFGEENLKPKDDGVGRLIPKKDGKEFLYYCLINNDNDYKNKLEKNIVNAFEEYFESYSEIKTFLDTFIPHPNQEGLSELIKSQNAIIVNITDNLNNNICKVDSCVDFPLVALRKGGIFGSFDCSFLKSDLAMTYRTLYDLYIEARILCALSCCISFFGAVFVYFFLLVLHHYDTELFPDNKAIFTGFEGFGKTKKRSNNDPQHKKRKLRAEVELSSRNEEYSGFQDGNKD